MKEILDEAAPLLQHVKYRMYSICVQYSQALDSRIKQAVLPVLDIKIDIFVSCPA